MRAIIAILLAAALSACRSLTPEYRSQLADAFAAEPAVVDQLLTERDIAHLPEPMQRYLRYVGAVGRPRVRNFRLDMAATMWQKPGARPMRTTIEQHSFTARPTRLFFLKARMYLLPVRVFHSYRVDAATMTVRVASAFNVVDLAGPDLSKAETVTFLNDVCVFAPAAVVDERFAWTAIDSASAGVRFTNGPYTVSATLYFNAAGELVNFVSDDRLALKDDGTLERHRWSTPLSNYQDFGGHKVSSYGTAVWHYPEGDFTYGAFTLRGISYNVSGTGR